MALKDQTFRIVKKSGDGAMVKIANGHLQLMPWSQFNDQMILLPGNMCKFKPEVADKFDEADQMINELLPIVLRANVLQASGSVECLSLFAIIGDKVPKIAELLNCTTIDVMQVIRQRIDFMKSPKRVMKAFNEAEKREKRRETRQMQRAVPTVTTREENGQPNFSGPTIGDLPGMDKLKSLF